MLLQIESLSLTFHGHDLIVDSELELNYGRFVYFPFITLKSQKLFCYSPFIHTNTCLFYLTYRRYGLLGLNGCGKSTLLTAIGCRELPIPEHMDIYHLSSEIEASDMSALQAVICCDEERMKLEKEAEILSAQVTSSSNASYCYICAPDICIGISSLFLLQVITGYLRSCNISFFTDIYRMMVAVMLWIVYMSG